MIEDKVKELMSKQMGEPIESFSEPNLSLHNNYHFEDEDIEDLALSLEIEFDISDIPDEDHTKWQTPQDIYDYIKKETS